MFGLPRDTDRVMVRWTPERMDRLESAARRGLRVALSRRGTEYIVVARRVTTLGMKEAFIGHLPMTGEDIVFFLNDIEDFHVIGDLAMTGEEMTFVLGDLDHFQVIDT